MKPPVINTTSLTESGYWRILVDPLPSEDSVPTDVTFFRNAATNVENLTTTDPFGPGVATLSFHSITLLDTPGMGDLKWLVPEANVDICWMSPQYLTSNVSAWSQTNTYNVGTTVSYNGSYYVSKLSVGPFPATWTSWNRLDTYSVGDYVLSTNGNVYVCIVNRSATTAFNTPQIDTTHWSLFNWQPNTDTTHWTLRGAPTGDVLYKWEGYFVSFDYEETEAGNTLTITCNGAMKQMDNFLAKPEYLSRPMTYEHAIASQFLKYPSSRLAPCRAFDTAVPYWYKSMPEHIYDPADFTVKTSSQSANSTYSYVYTPDPSFIKKGDVWSGMLTRSTGNFEPVLSNYIQNLLSSMQTQRGCFSLLLDKGRVPYFKHRTRLNTPASDTLIVDLLWPGVKVSITKDYSQEVNTVYGSGKTLSGQAFNNITFNANGTAATFEPFAANSVNYPATPTNPDFNKSHMAKEASLQFYDGLSASSAKLVAQKQLDMLSDPGMTGSITLHTDPQLNSGAGFARQMITAGMSILVRGLFGNRQGTLFHITEHSYSGEDNTVTLVIDSKFRDQLTVQEIRKRGRDSLIVARQLQIGKYAPAVEDLLYPWTYAPGDGKPASGYVPIASKVRVWDKVSNVDAFPWTNLTSSYSPSSVYNGVNLKSGPHNSAAAPYASLIGAASTTFSNKNWVKVPILLSSKGTIINSNFAAYKDDGTLYKVPFHVSIWYEDTISAFHMPHIPAPLTSTAGKGFAGVKLSIAPSALVGGVSKRLITATFKDAHKMYKGDTFYIKTGTNKIPTGVIYTVKNRTGANTLTFYVKTSDVHIAKNDTSTATVSINKILSNGTYSGNDGFSYKYGQAYPFFEQAWETKLPTGSNATDSATYTSNTPIVAWGTYYEKAGYWPNVSSETSIPTGQFQDTTPFSYDFTSQSVGVIANDTPENNQHYKVYKQPAPARITAYAMFYCDQEWDDTLGQLVPRKNSVHFLGRLYRQPPGM